MSYNKDQIILNLKNALLYYANGGGNGEVAREALKDNPAKSDNLLKNCHNCSQLKYHDKEDSPDGFYCNKRPGPRESEKKFLEKLQSEAYRLRAKSCAENENL